MSDLTEFKNKIFLYGILVAAICEVGSLPVIGPDFKFSAGLAVGTLVSIINFNVLSATLSSILSGGSKSLMFFSYIFRLGIYGAVFIVIFKWSTPAGVGCLIGFMTIKISAFYLHGIKTQYSKDRKNREEE